MDLNFLVQITKDEERTLMKAFAILAPLLYSSFWLYVPLFKTADIILRCALLASAIIAILYFERGFMGLISMSKGLELKIPLSVYVVPYCGDCYSFAYTVGFWLWDKTASRLLFGGDRSQCAVFSQGCSSCKRCSY